MQEFDIISYRDKIVGQCEKVIVGKREAIEKVLICFLCSGHVLLEDVPGTGKTMLLRAFAATIGGSFKRVQCTPDLLPSDLTGINFYNQKTGEFQFRPGPVFANLILADEINRATPRTQSALLEAMAERQVTVDGETHALSDPFMIMATQNPLESHGTFPLPEAQTDRFFMRLSLGYMDRAQELSVLNGEDTAATVASLSALVAPEDTAAAKQAISAVEVTADVGNYLMDIVTASAYPPAGRLRCTPQARQPRPLPGAAMSRRRMSRRWRLASSRTGSLPPGPGSSPKAKI